MECRVTVESPQLGFRPCPGLITAWQPPAGPGVRVDSHCYAGYRVPPFYDSLLAKLIVHGANRTEALQRLQAALARFLVRGVETTIPFLLALVSEPDFERGTVSTRWLEEMALQHRAIAAGAAR